MLITSPSKNNKQRWLWNDLEPFSLKVATSTGHSVTLVDAGDSILKRSIKTTEGSLKSGKKKFADKAEVQLTGNVTTSYSLLFSGFTRLKL